MRIIQSTLLLFIGILSCIYNSHSAITNVAYNWKSVVTGGGGGFVPGIVFNAKQKDVLYARTDIGGAYRWDATAKHWIPLLDSFSSDDWTLYGVDSIATDPVDPKKVYVAGGTYTNSWSGNGEILRSSDSGNTWQRTKLGFKLGGNMPGRSMGERLAIDPNMNSIIYFGARSGHGLHKSTDSGASFSKVSSFSADGKYVEKAGDDYAGDTIGEVWIVFDPKTGNASKATQSIYVGIADKGKSIYHSSDGGATWSAVAGQPTGYLPHHGVLASDGTLYVSYSDGAGPYDGKKGEVWKLNTATGAWTDISPVKSSSDDDSFGYGGLAVDGKDPKTVMVAALNSWWPDTIFWRSKDSGATWTRIWDYDGYPTRKNRYTMDITAAPWLNFGGNPTAPEQSPKLGWMVGALVIDPFDSNKMLYGTGATIYATHELTNWDQNKTFKIVVEAAGIEETSVLEVLSPPKGANLYSIMGDISGFKHDDLTKSPKEMYSVPFAGTYKHGDYAQLKSEIIVRVGDGKPSDNVKSGAITTNSGTSWSAMNDPSGLTQGGGTVAVSADGSAIVWSPGKGTISVSTDHGSSWKAVTGLTAGAKVGSDRVNPKKFYAYGDGKFHVSTDGGATFKDAASVADGKEFKAVPAHEGEIFLSAGDSGLYHSKDSGSTFSKVSGVAKATVVGYGMAKSGNYSTIYISGTIETTPGVFRSEDQGVSWVRVNDNQHQYGQVQCITGDSRVYGRVYIGTNGRGVLYGDPK